MSTVLFTGANSSLGLPAVQYLLSNFPTYTAILTVRNPTADDANTNRLRAIVAKFPNAKTSIRKLDLSSREEVRTFATQLNAEVASGELPTFAAIVCNAMTWSLNDGVKYSAEGLELSMAVNHIAQLGLVLRLLQSVDAQKGRIVFLSSASHRPDAGGFAVYPPTIPQDLDEWVHPAKDGAGEEAGRGIYRYGVSKLAVVMGMYALQRRLKDASVTAALETVLMMVADTHLAAQSGERSHSSRRPGGSSRLSRFLAARCSVHMESRGGSS